MPVLELTCLRLEGLAVDDPRLLKSLSAVRDSLHTQSHFYSCIEDPTIIYILGLWPSLDAHLAFLDSPAREQVLAPQQDLLSFQWTAHMELDSMRSLPLDAPILALERLRVEARILEAFDQAATKHAQHLRASHPFKVAFGWRIDAATGTHEALILSGWEREITHVSFAMLHKGRGEGGDAALAGSFEELVVHRGWNLERDVA